MINLLVGNPDSQMSVRGVLYRGRMLTLGAVDVIGTRVEAGRLTATDLPECRPIERADRTGPPLTSPPTASPPTVSDQSDAAETTTSSTTTTTTVVGTVPPGAPAVLGAAFSLGGAATSTQWWIGLPVSLLGLLLLTSSWLTPELMAGRRAAFVRRIVRAARPTRRARRPTRR
jgi:hypothetical protein